MLTILKHGLAYATLAASLNSFAHEIQIDCNESLDACGIAFTTIPATPTLTTSSHVTSSPYVITNVGSTSVPLSSVALIKQSSDTVGAGAVTIDGSTTCTSSTVLATSASCNIVLDFQPSNPGLLNWNLVVTPNSTQRPLSLNITTTVTGLAAVYSAATGAYANSGSTYYPMVALSTDNGSTWNYGVDSSGPSITNYDDTSGGNQGGILHEIICSGQLCLGGGSYTATDSNFYPVILSNGGSGNTWSTVLDQTWAQANLGTGVSGIFSTVDCASDLCIAAGVYFPASGGESPLAAISTDGGNTWSVVINHDSNTFPNYQSQPSINGSQCIGSTCIIVGTYVASPAFTSVPLLGYTTDNGATWTYPTLTVPSDNRGDTELLSIDCTGMICVAIGNYSYDSKGDYAGFAYVSIDGGITWTLRLASPNATNSTLSSSGIPSDWLNGQFGSVDCSTQACLIVGGYTSTTGSTGFPLGTLALASDTSNFSVWNAVIDSSSTLPTDSGDFATFNGAACSGTTCVASGNYTDNGTLGGIQWPLVGLISGGSVSYPIDGASNTAPGIVSGPEGNQFAYIGCSGSYCMTSGYYYTSTGQYPLMAVSSDTGSTWSYAIDNDASTLPSDFDAFGQFSSSAVSTEK